VLDKTADSKVRKTQETKTLKNFPRVCHDPSRWTTEVTPRPAAAASIETKGRISNLRKRRITLPYAHHNTLQHCIASGARAKRGKGERGRVLGKTRAGRGGSGSGLGEGRKGGQACTKIMTTVQHGGKQRQ
jgi:hypothetical protein